MIKISVSQLRQVADVILRNLVENLEVDAIKIPVAYYDVQHPDRYNYHPGGPYPAPTVGDFSEDWGVIEPLDPQSPDSFKNLVTVLTQISNILRYIGDHDEQIIK
jgi:hypothetical protein